MSHGDTDLGASKDARKKLRADYDIAKSIAQLLFQAIIFNKEEWSLDSTLCEGFQVEVENIRRVGLSLSNGCTAIDSKVIVYMARLRRCYNDYKVLVVKFSGRAPAILANDTGEEVESISQKKLSYDVFLGDLMVKNEILWSTSKLLDVLEQSRDCTSRLLNYTSIMIFNISTSDSAPADLKEDPYAGLNCSDADDDAVSSQSEPNVPMLGRHILSDIKPLAEYQMGSLIRQGTVSGVFVERKHYDCSSNAKSCASAHRSLLHLAEGLHRLCPRNNSGLLSFRGLVKFEPKQGSYAFVYDLPHGHQERPSYIFSLRDLMARQVSSEQPAPHPRLQIAHKISTALSRLHAGGILHKNLRRRSVVFFCTSSDAIPWDSPYLVNSDFSRPIREQTSYYFARDLERGISQHPACQGVPNESFTQEYDIYALGVLLLEIGLWSSAKDIFAGENNGVPPTKSTSLVRIQNRLRVAAKTLLHVFMGRQYADVVVACLSGSSSSYWARGCGPGLSTASIAERIEKLDRFSQDDVIAENSLEKR